MNGDKDSDTWIIHGYTVHNTHRLGRGSFGTVYKATSPDGRHIAAKEISLERHDTSTIIKEAMNFYKIRREKHPNIVNIYDVKRYRDLQRNEMWIFMECCRHGDLEKFFRKNFDLLKDMSLKYDLMVQITKGIEYLHAHDIVHRDIKPANILISEGRGLDTYVAKLTDFGLSKYLDPAGDTSGMSSNVGTMTFQAPEHFEADPDGHLRYHRNVDIFATGLTFLSMIEAREGTKLQPSCPYHRCIGMALYMKKTTGKPQCNVMPGIEPVENDDDMTKKVKGLVRVMTHIQPEKRPTASQVLCQLVSYLLSTTSLIQKLL